MPWGQYSTTQMSAMPMMPMRTLAICTSEMPPTKSRTNRDPSRKPTSSTVPATTPLKRPTPPRMMAIQM